MSAHFPSGRINPTPNVGPLWSSEIATRNPLLGRSQRRISGGESCVQNTGLPNSSALIGTRGAGPRKIQHLLSALSGARKLRSEIRCWDAPSDGFLDGKDAPRNTGMPNSRPARSEAQRRPAQAQLKLLLSALLWGSEIATRNPLLGRSQRRISGGESCVQKHGRSL